MDRPSPRSLAQAPRRETRLGIRILLPASATGFRDDGSLDVGDARVATGDLALGLQLNTLAHGDEPVLWGMATISALAAAAMVRVGQHHDPAVTPSPSTHIAH